MKVYSISKYSKTDKLRMADVSLPNIKVDEVLVEIHAASINQLDAKLKSGEFKMVLPYKLLLILGHDLAGIIAKVGSNVKQFKVGDEVFARVADFKIGTFAEFIAVSEKDLALKPKDISMEAAASLPLVVLRVWQAFVEKSNLKKGKKIFIQAGSGGVGIIAIQLAKHFGATVATTTSTANFELVKSLGADVVIDYRTQDFETVLKDYDLVLHSQDAKTLEKSLRLLKPGGKVISISGPPDIAFAKEVRMSWLMKTAIFFLSSKVRKQAKKLNIDYSFLFMKANGKQLSEIATLIESGVIKPIMDKVYSFDQMNEAMDYVENGRAKGKVVVEINNQ